VQKNSQSGHAIAEELAHTTVSGENHQTAMVFHLKSGVSSPGLARSQEGVVGVTWGWFVLVAFLNYLLFYINIENIKASNG